MIASLPFDLRGLRDRAILPIGYAGGLRRSEIVSLDCGRVVSAPGLPAPGNAGWVDIEDAGAILHLRGKTGWREVEIARGSSDQICPVHGLEQWLHFAKIDVGPLFRRGRRALRPETPRLRLCRNDPPLPEATGQVKGEPDQGHRVVGQSAVFPCFTH